MNKTMLQHQIMFKQLQKMQRRQQLQEISNTRNMNCVNQLSSLKHASGGQVSPSINGMSVDDPSGMFTVGNMQMIQHGGPNGLFLSQGPLGLSQPQLNISLYGSQTPNLDDNLNQYSHLQGLSNLSVNLLSKNNALPSAFGNSFMSQQCNFSSDQISMPGGSVVLNQEKNLFGQSSVEGFRSGNLSGNYSQHGITMQGNATSLDYEGGYKDTHWCELSPGKTSNHGIEDPDNASLDPLEQKILYNTDDNSWESSFSRIRKMGPGGFGGASECSSLMDALPSVQSGSWSALMQSALEETSGNDPGVQEEWSGLSFQNPEPSNEIQQANFIDREKLQYNWVNRNSPNVVSPSSMPEHLSHQKDAYHSNNDEHLPSFSSCANANQLHNNFSGNETRGDFWLRGSTSQHVPSGIQKSYDQVNQLKIHGYSGKPENMAAGGNVETKSTVLDASLECPVGNAPSASMLELLNKDDISNDQTPAMQLNTNVSTPGELPSTETSIEYFAKACKVSPLQPDSGRPKSADLRTPQPHSFFPSLSIETSSATILSSHNVNHDVENQCPASPVSSLMTSQQDTSSSKPYKFSNLFHSPDSSSGSLGTSSSVPNEQHCQNSFQHENSVQEYSGKSAWHGQRLEKGSSLHECSNEINRSASLTCNIQKQEYFRKHQLGADAVRSESLTTIMHQQPSSQSEGTQKGTLSFPATDIGALSHTLSQNYSLLHHMHSRKNAGTDDFKSSPPKYNSVNYQHSMPNSGKLLLSGQKSEDNDIAKDDLNAVSKLGAFWSRENKESNFSQEGQGDMSGKALSTSYHQYLQQKGMFSQNGIPIHSFGSNEASKLAYQSRVSFPMAPSWFKHNLGNSKNGQMLPIFDPSVTIHASQQSSEMGLGNLQENSLITQVNLACASQGSDLHLSSVGTPTPCEQLNLPSALPSDSAQRNLSESLLNKRKLVALDLVPWHKEVNRKQPRLQDIRTSEFSWAQASNRKEEEVKYEAECFEECLPLIQPKRRLISTTQLMQQVFRPAPSVILCSDASPSCDCMTYYAARLALGDAYSLTGQLRSGLNDVARSPDKLNTSKFSKVVECFIDRVKKLEGDITRLEKSLSFVDIKVEALELEKFSTINRFAKFLIRAHPSTVDSSGTTTMPKPHPQRYVVGHPMPMIVPEGLDCLYL